MLELVVKFKERLHSLEEVFHLSRITDDFSRIEKEMENPNFWDDPDQAASTQKKRSQLLELVEIFKTMKADLQDIEEFAPLADSGDEDIVQEISTKSEKISKMMDDLEFRRMLSGELDHSSAILSINSGAGGTEAQDWVAMLSRMYLRWAEKKKFGIEILDSLPGDGAGYKNITITIDGPFSYGFLRAEQGIHRLVRISPFDANARRHTSFASVAVLPQIDDDIKIDIKDEDLRIDTYRAGGAGGQHVNKTDSAVRLTHIPSGLVVTCQNERSQHKNRASAMKVLRARLYELQEQENRKQKEKLGGEKKNINFGSQIRSYTLQPYQLIKDHRTDYESSKVQDVLDGDIDGYIKAYLLEAAKESVV